MSNQQANTPLFTTLLNHAKKQPVPFHIPGHKKGKGVDPEFRAFIGSAAFQIDLINISPLDDLHHPQATIQEAQELAAHLFHADHTFFSVQGTSTAIMTMILSICKPGDKIIVPRNIHKSVLSALILADAIPIFIQAEIDKELLISHNITTEQVEQTLKQHPDAKAILLIHPTYYGVVCNIVEVVKMAQQYHIPVLVDEAHGALFSFHKDLPISAMEAGADLAATSLHKLGGSLTQSSLLNLKQTRVNPQHVQSIFNMMTTTSTSYLLLASLDTQRRYLALYGRQSIDQTLQLAKYARDEINQIPGLYCPDEQLYEYHSVHQVDPTKLIIHLEQMEITGHEAEIWLRQKHRIEVELSDLHNILCIISIGDDQESINQLLFALRDLSSHFYQQSQNRVQHITIPDLPELVMSPREAFYHTQVRSLPLEQSIHYVSAESITIYPPGIPILLPGERITREHILYIKENLEAGLPVQGTLDPEVTTIRVIY
ncbi:Arginine/lysine/ornithine decarboxylase [Seinonella peptonophila]|uniref:Arginine/lysine/ornithine decarboxylase n=1 Tax=Seinonella peptonophila TaxID=112248 RepID=A0A1M4V389_9BACL|nr:aminotransferase class I/II-fold pyridoxal phosphate-dependent enzyme [Seinonella peptonophila]SHE63415.1 Arginine/lysine/ornithine decarboxylase [Seinonella peptonophila]